MTRIELHGFTLDLPNDHWLPQTLNQSPEYCQNIGRIASAVERKYPGRGFIDVGANVGDTAAIVRAHSNVPILCIEGSEFYYQLLKENVRQLQAEVELECALVDSTNADRRGCLILQHGTAEFRMDSSDGPLRRFARLDSILGRHPRFRDSKILKIHTDGMDGRILQGAMEWMAAARPVLFWRHDMGRDAAADGPGMHIFEGLWNIGYRTALLFHNSGEFIRTVSLDEHRQLAELSGYRDVCAFHEEDHDLGSRIRLLELENRRTSSKDGSKQDVRGPAAMTRNPRQQGSLAAELQVLSAQTQFDRNRQQLRIMDLETRVSSKDSEIHKLHLMLRDLLVELHAERTTRNQNEERSQAEQEELKGQLISARGESHKLRHELDTSLTLRVARSMSWILGPIRRLTGGSTNGGRP